VQSDIVAVQANAVGIERKLVARLDWVAVIGLPGGDGCPERSTLTRLLQRILPGQA
jgi:hypothetical protein